MIKLTKKLAQLQSRLQSRAADLSQNDTTTVTDHSQHGNMPEENNSRIQWIHLFKRTMANISFSTEQHNIASLRKCFNNATKADVHQTKNGKADILQQE